MNACVCGNSADGNGTMCSRCVALQEIGLKASANDADIKAAYRLYVKAWHPDHFPGDEKSKRAGQEKLKNINSAYDFLTSGASKRGQRPTVQTAAPPPTQPQEPRQKPNTGAQAPPRPPSPSSSPPPGTPRRDWPRFMAAAFLLTAIAVWVLFRNPPNQTQPSSGSPSITTSTVQPQNEPTTGTVNVPKGLTLDPSGNAGSPSDFAVSLPNGTELRKRRRLNGRGELTVENGTSSDAVVHLVDLSSEKTIRTFYVKAGNTFTERQISPGLYEVYFATGTDWNAGLRTFNSSANYHQFGRNLEFSEKRDPEKGKIEYGTYQITLQPVMGGNAATFPSDKSAFDKLMNDPTTD